MPLYWRLFEGTPAFNILMHRCMWAFPFLFLFASIQKKWVLPEKIAFDRKRFPWLIASGLLIGSNWWIYIYGVESHHVIEMSLGYFLSPLFSAAMGVLIVRERLVFFQWIGVITVGVGVAWYSTVVGHIPYMALGLALTFSFYGLIRKVTPVHPMTALLTETMILFFVAIGYLILHPGNTLFGETWDVHYKLLVLSGPLTSLPLLWFAAGVRGLTMTTMGILNYISPTGKLILAVFFFGEVLTTTEFASFALLWCGIVVYLRATFVRYQRN
jgi:chloramphenicol-sensitive protein RarD